MGPQTQINSTLYIYIYIYIVFTSSDPLPIQRIGTDQNFHYIGNQLIIGNQLNMKYLHFEVYLSSFIIKEYFYYFSFQLCIHYVRLVQYKYGDSGVQMLFQNTIILLWPFTWHWVCISKMTNQAPIVDTVFSMKFSSQTLTKYNTITLKNHMKS